MESARKTSRVLQVAYVVAGLIGLKFGFDAGNQISGVVLGVVMAVNTALIAVIFVGTIADRMSGGKRTAAPTRPGEPG